MANLIAEVGARGEGQSEHALAVRSMFDRISPTYDLLNRLLSMGIDRSWRRRALELLAEKLPAEGALLDSCAGTLDLAQALEARFPERKLVAGDFAREMLVRGQGKVARSGLLAFDAMRIPLRDGALAGMTCAFGMRNLSDNEQGLREAHRVLKPGGVFAAWGYSWHTVDSGFDAAFEREVLRPLHGHWPEQNRKLWNGYRDEPFPYERIEAPRFALELEWSLEQVLDYVGTWSATRARLREEPRFLDLAREALEPAWETSSRRVTMPIVLLVGRHAG